MVRCTEKENFKVMIESCTRVFLTKETFVGSWRMKMEKDQLSWNTKKNNFSDKLY